MKRFKLDPANPWQPSPEERALMDSLTDEEIEANAESDPDNPPFTEAELAIVRKARLVQVARGATGLSQPEFAKTYRFSLGRLRDLEQGRTTPDDATLAYLALIRRDPAAVRQALEEDAA